MSAGYNNYNIIDDKSGYVGGAGKRISERYHRLGPSDWDCPPWISIRGTGSVRVVGLQNGEELGQIGNGVHMLPKNSQKVERKRTQEVTTALSEMASWPDCRFHS